MAYTKYSLTPSSNTAAPPDGAPEGMLPSAVNDTMRDMMAQIRDCGDGIRDGTYTMTAAKITGGTITGITFSSIVVTGGSITGATVTSNTFSSSGATITGGSVTGITDLAIADGGTGASTAAGARTNLGLDGFVNMKNRIINGAMVIDQRNDGASVTPASGDYTLDRFQAFSSASSKYSVQQNAGSVTPPVGFKNYLGVTSLATTSVGAGDYYMIEHKVEGLNCYDLAWGTANAKTVTLSFQVYSSLTGTFGGSILNSASNRSYPFTYTISTANTWTSISVTIAGDTSGTWLTTNGTGLYISFSLGMGSTYSGTAGAWAGSQYWSATGATSVVGTNGATFYITGVQLEVGSTATSFDYRPYGAELDLCYRYYYKIFPAQNSKGYGNGTSVNTTNIYNTVPSPVTMRVNPTLETTGTASDYAIVRGGGTNTACDSVPTISDQSHRFMLQVNASLSSGLIDGYSGWLRTNSASSYLGFNAEL